MDDFGKTDISSEDLCEHALWKQTAVEDNPPIYVCYPLFLLEY